MSQGGKREGAGRKARPDGKGRTVPKSIKVSQEVADYLAKFGTGVIEDALRKTKAFRDWAKAHNDVVFDICDKCNLPCGGRCR